MANEPINKPTQLALRTRVCLMAAIIYGAQEITVERAATLARELENAVDKELEASKR